MEERNRFLYRAKRKDNGEWIIGNLIQSKTRSWISSEEADHTRLRMIGNYIADWRGYEVDSKTICQCVGSRDKNKKLLFENDIIKGKMHGTYGYRVHSGVIEYFRCEFKVNIDDNHILGDYKNIPYVYEIIGNKFDNPELIKK